MDEPDNGEDVDSRPRTSDSLPIGQNGTQANHHSSSPKIDDTYTHDKKRKRPDEDAQTHDKQSGSTNQSLSKRKRREERHQKLRRRSNAPASVFSRRDQSRSPSRRAKHLRDSTSSGRSPEYRSRENPSRRSPSSQPRQRSPTPEAQHRQRKRPGGGARLGLAERDALKRRQEERERAQQHEVTQALRDRGVADVVRQHYNMVPERGREWRKTDSRIKGLRSFNNWIKSTLIQKFSPDEEFLSQTGGSSRDWTGGNEPPTDYRKLLVVDLGCGKGGDLGKWQLAPQPVDLYVGLDPADISIEQARDRYSSMKHGRGRTNRRGHSLFHAEFYPKDCFGEWLGDLDIIKQVGIDANVGPGGSIMSSRWGGGGFDVVASMFTMHYAFESEQKARQMLQNVAGVLKKGGRFLGVGPNSDVISEKVAEFHRNRKKHQEAANDEGQNGPEDGEVEDKSVEWGNGIYRVRFPEGTPEDGIFRPPFGWKYSYFMVEAVEEIPEYVVPWEAFRA
jgi:mRNA (guanine-N7-)-methyltransferase